MSLVVLLHGIARTSASLRRLEQGLQAAGCVTRNVDYPSRRHSLDALTDGLHRRIGAEVERRVGPVHFVGHSMGGLLARAYITRHRPPGLGRVVQLGSPNQGSEIADLLGPGWLYRRFFGPAGQQLGTRADPDLVQLLGPVDYPMGVIAGTRSIDPLGWLLIPGANDGKVSVARTRLSGMADHVSLRTTHALMVRNRQVIAHTIHFLQHGRFPHSSSD